MGSPKLEKDSSVETELGVEAKKHWGAESWEFGE